LGKGVKSPVALDEGGGQEPAGLGSGGKVRLEIKYR